MRKPSIEERPGRDVPVAGEQRLGLGVVEVAVLVVDEQRGGAAAQQHREEREGADGARRCSRPRRRGARGWRVVGADDADIGGAASPTGPVGACRVGGVSGASRPVRRSPSGSPPAADTLTRWASPSGSASSSSRTTRRRRSRRCSIASRTTSSPGSPRSSSATTPARTRPTSSASATSRSTGGGCPSTCCATPGTSATAATRRSGYGWAIEHDLDIVVLLHADGQYAPELLPEIVAPLERGEADAVFGSRMMTPGGARSGGMPLYKFVGNKILTTYRERDSSGTELSEWHSGYRAYRSPRCARSRSSATPTSTTSTRRSSSSSTRPGSGSSRSRSPPTTATRSRYVNGLRYANDIVKDVHQVPRPQDGHRHAATPRSRPSLYEPKAGSDTATGRMLAWLSGAPPVGCSSLGVEAELDRCGAARVPGTTSSSSWIRRARRAARPTTRSVAADLDDGIPAAVGADFDVVVAVDALGRVRDSSRLLAELRRVYATGWSARSPASRTSRTGTRVRGCSAVAGPTTPGAPRRRAAPLLHRR